MPDKKKYWYFNRMVAALLMTLMVVATLPGCSISEAYDGYDPTAQ
jgi:hypothetical protein